MLTQLRRLIFHGTKDKAITAQNRDKDKERHEANRHRKRGRRYESRMVIVKEVVGNIFESPSPSILIHSCNVLGNWGAGVAAEFAKRYPIARKEYYEHCWKNRDSRDIRGTCLLIEPRDTLYGEHYVACLFVSRGFGRDKDGRQQIIENTRSALGDLEHQVESLKRTVDPGECFSVRLNNGLFGVDWKVTKSLLEASLLNLTVVNLAPTKPKPMYIGFAD